MAWKVILKILQKTCTSDVHVLLFYGVVGKSKKRSAPDDAALKAERKRAKFDPTQIKTVSQMTEQIAVKEQAMKGNDNEQCSACLVGHVQYMYFVVVNNVITNMTIDSSIETNML